MPQNEHIELHRKRHGRRFDHYEKLKKKEGRLPHILSKKAQTLRGIKAKIYNKRRANEKIQMKKTIKKSRRKRNKTTARSTGRCFACLFT